MAENELTIDYEKLAEAILNRVHPEGVRRPKASEGEGFFELRVPSEMITNRAKLTSLFAHLQRYVIEKKPKGPCENAVFVRVVSSTTECVNHKVVYVDTLEWVCPPDNHIDTSVERTETEFPC